RRDPSRGRLGRPAGHGQPAPGAGAPGQPVRGRLGRGARRRMSRALGVLLVAALAAACGGDDGPRDDAGGAPAVARFDPEALRFPGADLVLISMDTLRADRLGAYG